MFNVTGYNIPRTFADVLWTLRRSAMREKSRNGYVRALQQPIAVTILNPTQRVIFDAKRDANPFFHVMEFVWMMAGSRSVGWITQFNKRMAEYSNDGIVQPAAYGYRWRMHFGFDQIQCATEMLKKDPTTRRAVLAMWNPRDDLGFLTTKDSADIPCNTQMMLRVRLNKLDVLVTNRSNDAIWGMMGANAVHMTMLQELIARECHLEIGAYQVVSNNLHIYESVPNFDYYMNSTPLEDDRYYTDGLAQVPLLQSNETYLDFTTDARRFVDFSPQANEMRTFWFKHVACPMYWLWKERREETVQNIAADDWRVACEEWLARRRTAVGNIDGGTGSTVAPGK